MTSSCAWSSLAPLSPALQSRRAWPSSPSAGFRARSQPGDDRHLAVDRSARSSNVIELPAELCCAPLQISSAGPLMRSDAGDGRRQRRLTASRRSSATAWRCNGVRNRTASGCAPSTPAIRPRTRCTASSRSLAMLRPPPSTHSGPLSSSCAANSAVCILELAARTRRAPRPCPRPTPRWYASSSGGGGAGLGCGFDCRAALVERRDAAAPLRIFRRSKSASRRAACSALMLFRSCRIHCLSIAAACSSSQSIDLLQPLLRRTPELARQSRRPDLACSSWPTLSGRAGRRHARSRRLPCSRSCGFLVRGSVGPELPAAS